MTSSDKQVEDSQKAVVDDGLTFTGKFAGGLRNDLKRRLPLYLDDYKQGFHPKVLGSILFLFFACIANAIAFGGLTGLVTDGQIGTTESSLTSSNVQANKRTMLESTVKVV